MNEDRTDKLDDLMDRYLFGLLDAEGAGRVRRRIEDDPEWQLAYDAAVARKRRLAEEVGKGAPAPGRAPDATEVIAAARKSVGKRRKRQRIVLGGFGAVAATVALVIGVAWIRYAMIRPPVRSVRVVGQESLLAGSRAGFRAIVTALDGAGRQADVPVKLLLMGGEAPVVLAEWRTDAQGVAAGGVDVPDWPEGSYQLVATAGEDRPAEVSTPITIHRARKVFLSTDKPILLMKSGGTGAGSKAASSHTGSLAGDEAAYECVFERAGIIRCGSITEQFDIARAVADQPLPEGPSVAVVTNAGGPGIMAADAIERTGLTFADLDEKTREKLEAGLPPSANVHNPVDVLGDALAGRYEFAIETVLEDPNVDTVLVLLTPQSMTECEGTARAIAKLAGRNGKKPVLACFMGGQIVEGAHGILCEGGIPNYDSPERAILVIKAVADYVRWLARPKRVVKLFPVNRRKADQIISRSVRRGIRQVGESESKEILEAYGFLTPKGALAGTAEQAVGIANRLGYPIVMKIWSPDISHKSDVGGVKVGLKNATEVCDAFDLMMLRIPKKMPDASILGVLVQEMCSSGHEIILGMNRDPQFGPIMMFGMGGVLVETLKDVSFYLATLTAEEALEMLVSTKTYRLLRGVRGHEGVDIQAVAEGLQRLSQLVTEFPQIQELDINPYVVGPTGTTPIAVDARIVLRET